MGKSSLCNYLIEDLGYLESWIRIEQEIKINNLKKRFDIVVTGSDFNPIFWWNAKLIR